VRSPCVVVVDPGPHGETGVFDGLEAPRPAELLLEGFDEALAKTVLLRRVGCDVFLRQAVVLDHGPVLARPEDQAVVVPRDHAGRGVAQRAEAVEQRFLQGSLRGLGPARSFQGVAEDFTGQQSMTGTKTHQPSLPQWTNARSVAHHSLGDAATDREASTRGRRPVRRFGSVQPLSFMILTWPLPPPAAPRVPFCGA